MDWLNYHHLLYFWMTAKEGSVVKASEKLHLSQPTISNQLKTLEQTIGHQLFQRTGRQLILTEVGQDVFRYADAIFTMGQDLQHFLLGQSQSSHRKRLQIGITDSLPKLVSYRILEPLLYKQNELRFVCYEDDNLEGLLQRLAVYELDLVLADAPVPPGARFRAYNHLLGECGVSFFGTREFARQYGPGFPKSLNQAPMLLPSDNTALRAELEAWFSAEGIYPEIIAEFDDMALLKIFCQKGKGIMCLPTVVEQDIVRTLDVEVLGHEQLVKSEFYAISVERRIRQPLILELVEHARQSIFNVPDKS